MLSHFLSQYLSRSDGHFGGELSIYGPKPLIVDSEIILGNDYQIEASSRFLAPSGGLY
jgi:hypothetical protein